MTSIHPQPAVTVQSGVPVQPGMPDPEFQTWSRQHARENRRHAADLAQITHHHDLNPAGDAVHQLQAWAVRQAREKHLHDSAIAQIRRP